MGIKRIKFKLASLGAGAVLALSSLAALPAMTFASEVGNTVAWTGQGSESVKACDTGQTPYLHWIFTTGGNSSVTAADLTVSGSASGGGAMSEHGGSWTLDTAYSGTGQPTTSTLSASVMYIGTLGSGTSNLVISDGCYGTGGSGGVTDVCANLEGDQATVPEGYHADGNNCYPNEQETDMCPNIDGNQATVPEGMHLDNQGNCVENEEQTDMCPNIEGNQAEVPEGMHVDGQGNCVENETNNDKVTLCHATGSATNPYVEITVSTNAVTHEGHDGHSGDIIPAFEGYAGKNLDQLSILNNHCVVGGQGGGTQDCDGDFDNSASAECTTTTVTTTGQVLGAQVVAGGMGGAQVTVVPQGSVNGGGGAASKATSGASAVGLVGSLFSLGTGLALFNRKQS